MWLKTSKSLFFFCKLRITFFWCIGKLFWGRESICQVVSSRNRATELLLTPSELRGRSIWWWNPPNSWVAREFHIHCSSMESSSGISKIWWFQHQMVLSRSSGGVRRSDMNWNQPSKSIGTLRTASRCVRKKLFSVYRKKQRSGHIKKNNCYRFIILYLFQ